MKKGVLLVNLGTPEVPEAPAVKQYLAQFLSDKRVIDYPRFIWLPILHGIILKVRPEKSAKLYKKIWRPEGSPLAIYTKAQADNLQQLLPDYQVTYAMTYGQPSIAQKIVELQKNCSDITILPLYPQYSDTTVAPIYDQLATIGGLDVDQLNKIKDFHDNPLYISLLAANIQGELSRTDYDLLLFSYHGVPVSVIQKGDPYARQCQKTTEAVMELVKNIPYQLTYQSKFGPAKWLTPATSETLMALPKKGIKKVLVVTPGFVADCLETLEEIEEENRQYFLANGGELFDYLHPFNESWTFTEVLKELVLAAENVNQKKIEN
ncbi:ferrochelatase [Enterococcus sp. LJL120]